MKDKKKIEILLTVIEKAYNRNPGIQTLIDKAMIDICKEESVSVVFCCSLLLALLLWAI